MWIWLAILLVLCMTPALAETEELRGYIKGQGYQYVQLGDYPYERDGTEAPVLWRILAVEDGNALLLTEYVVDTQQVIFETDKKKIEKRQFRQINSYAESDLYVWMNTVALDTLLDPEDPLRGALVEEPGGGKFFILTSEQFLTTAYGFANDRWNEQRSRFAKGTPYAVKSRNLYTEGKYDTSPYWASTIKKADDYYMQLVGYNGHLSYGAYTRVNVGLRPSVRLNLSLLTISSGTGTKEDPFVFTFSGETPPESELADVTGE